MGFANELSSWANESFFVMYVVAAEVTEKYFDTAPWQKAMPRNSGKGEFETRWLCRHVIAQQATAAKRQMRCNQIPRKMLQKLQEDHHRRRLEAERSGQAGANPPDPRVRHLSVVARATASRSRLSALGWLASRLLPDALGVKPRGRRVRRRLHRLGAPSLGPPRPVPPPQRLQAARGLNAEAQVPIPRALQGRRRLGLR